MSESGTSWVHVRLLGLPVEIHRRSGEHREALRRELDLIEHAHAADAAPARLQALGDELAGRYGALTESQTKQLLEAMEAGTATIDLEFELPPDIVDATLRLGALFEELDDFCRDGDLLTLVTPPDLREYRSWVLGEFTSQVRDGQPPRAWTNHVAAPAPAAAAEDVQPETARVRVEDDLDLASAPAVRRELLDRIDQGATDIVVDLSGCDFLDSTGLSLLVTTHHRLVELGGGLRIAGAKDQVRGVLEMSGTTDFFGKG